MTREISLLLIDERLAAELDDGLETFQAAHGVRIVPNTLVLREVISQTLAMITASPRDPVWGGYLVVDPDVHAIVGTCGFKTGPTDNGSIEIAYFTFPEFEGQGYATAMATRLKDLALTSPSVHLIIAHTLPERNPSTRILEKIGLRRTGEIEDPVDGIVWRWEYFIGE